MLRILPLVVVVPALAMALVLSCNMTSPSRPVADDAAAKAKITLPEKGTIPVVAERPSGFAVLLSGNWLGHLEPCGCTEKQLGGIDRRTGTIDKILPDRQGGLLVDVGGLIDNTGRQSQLKLEVFLYSLRKLGYDAAGLSAMEWMLLLEELDIEAKDRPVLICSNMPAKERGRLWAEEFLEKSMLLSDGHELKTLVLAICEPGEDSVKLNLQEPVAAVERILAKRSIAADKASEDTLVVVMLAGSDEELIKKLRHIAAVDIVVAHGFAEEPEIIVNGPDGAIAVTTGQMGKYITRFDIDSAYKGGKIHDSQFSAVEIDSRYKRDQSIIDIINDYQLRIQMEDLVADEAVIPREMLTNGDCFVGSKKCDACHEEIYNIWSKKKHAHAMDTLIRVNRQYDPDCVVCHTVGIEYESGYRGLDKTPDLANVGCEMCHGPGGNHIDNEKHYDSLFTSCIKCHTHEASPSFEHNRAKYMEKIKHW
jgi:hypothetical protein